MSSASTLGWFERDLSRGCWTWSAEFYRIHGYQPGEVEPTTALVVQHKHPDDVARAQQVIAAASSGRAFSLEALAFLRRWSMQHNVRVVDAAEALIAAFEDRRPGVPVVVSDVLQQLVGD